MLKQHSPLPTRAQLSCSPHCLPVVCALNPHQLPPPPSFQAPSRAEPSTQGSLASALPSPPLLTSENCSQSCGAPPSMPLRVASPLLPLALLGSSPSWPCSSHLPPLPYRLAWPHPHTPDCPELTQHLPSPGSSPPPCAPATKGQEDLSASTVPHGGQLGRPMITCLEQISGAGGLPLSACLPAGRARDPGWDPCRGGNLEEQAP